MARTFLVIAPTEMKSTPVAAMLTHGVQSDSARRLERRGWVAFIGVDGNGPVKQIQREVVEQKPLSFCTERLAQLVERFNLDFDRHVGMLLAGLLNGGGDTAGTQYVVFLDQHGVEQAHTVIETPATPDGILLCAPETGDGFASIENPAIATDGCHVFCRLRRGPGEQLQKIQESPFPGQNRACRSCKRADDGLRLDTLTILKPPCDRDARVELAHGFLGPGATREDERLARHNGCAGTGRCR